MAREIDQRTNTELVLSCCMQSSTDFLVGIREKTLEGTGFAPESLWNLKAASCKFTSTSKDISERALSDVGLSCR